MYRRLIAVPYTAKRNHLVLERRAERWTAERELEKSGRTPPVAI